MPSLTHTLYHFLERIMSDVLKEHGGNVSFGGRTITNLLLCDGTGALAENKQGLEQPRKSR